MDNPEYTFQILEVFSKVRSKEIPRELEEYISYVARTGDPVFQWSMVKVLIKEKLLAVLNEFVENGGPIDVPPCPNVDQFDYDSMKEHVLKHLDAFLYPPFTIQRICELLAAPRKEYNRVDKYMRAIEKNVLVVSASDLSMKRALESDANESVINGILYDKVNDSLTGFSNHVFTAASVGEHEDELNVVGAKMDETDAVQRIIDESWNEEASGGDDFKLNGSGSSFEHELQQFVGAEKGDDDIDTKTEPSSSSSDSNTVATSSSSFDDENSATSLLQPSLQNIIAEGTSISFEDVAAVTKEDEESESSLKDANDTYEFKEDSLEDANTNVSELLPASDELSSAEDDDNVPESSEATPVDVVEDDSHVKRRDFVDCQLEEPSTTTLEMMAVTVTDETSIDEPMTTESFEDAAEAQPESTSVEAAGAAECSLGEVQAEQINLSSEVDESGGWITYSAGDYQEEKNYEEPDGNSKTVSEELSHPPLAEVDVEPETTTTQMETSQSVE